MENLSQIIRVPKKYKELLGMLSKEDVGNLFLCLFDYEKDNNLEGTAKIIFNTIKVDLENLDKSANNGKKGGKYGKLSQETKKEESQKKDTPQGDPPGTPLKEDKTREDKRKEKEINSHFETFWELYPRKVAKSEAKKKYLIKCKNTNPDDIYKGLKKYMKYWDRRGKTDEFIPDTPHPTTWINQERWNDEIEKQTTTTSEDEYLDWGCNNIPKFIKKYGNDLTMNYIEKHGW